VASAIWYGLLAFVGYKVAENWEAVKSLVDSTNRALGIAAIVLTTTAILWLWQRSRRRG
jgi:membrane protein DedA with SNARE-associated domain